MDTYITSPIRGLNFMFKLAKAGNIQVREEELNLGSSISAKGKYWNTEQKKLIFIFATRTHHPFLAKKARKISSKNNLKFTCIVDHGKGVHRI